MNKLFNGSLVSMTPEDAATLPKPETAAESFLDMQAQQESARQSAYTAEADPLFFKWQAGESTEAEWRAKREEIRARFPYPDAG